MSFRIVELIGLPRWGRRHFRWRRAKPFSRHVGWDDIRRRQAELSGSRANPLPDAFVHIVALAECEDMNGEVHGDNDSTVGCVGVLRSAAVALSLLPERALPFGLGRPEPAVIRRREPRGAKRV